MPYRDRQLNKMARKSWRRRDRVRRRLFLNWLKDQPCLDCDGHFSPECMDFDHRPGVDKVFEIQQWVVLQTSLQLLQVEIMKCDLICSNCHRIRTQRRHRDPMEHLYPRQQRRRNRSLGRSKAALRAVVAS